MAVTVVPPGKPVKLVVWGADNTLWSAPRSADAPSVHPLTRLLVATLDERGILQSVVDRDDPARALAKLQRSGLAEYFLSPQLGACDTSQSVGRIASELNIGIDSVLLIDDQSRERERVAHAHPLVRTLESTALDALADDPLMGQSLADSEPRPRRLVYLEEQARRRSERDFPGSSAEFLATLDMTLTVTRAQPADLRRVQELVTRTNQLGISYSAEELQELLCSPRHVCWLVSLRDRFGDCGKVALVLLEAGSECWTLQLFLCSCRIVSRGIDAIILNALLHRACAAGLRMRAHFRATRRNESLALAYRRAGFVPIGSEGDLSVLAHPLTDIPPHPSHIRLCGDWTDDV
jgi:FkbH-like protein